MPTCPACGSGVAEDAKECPGCHLAVSLFAAVREAAGPSADQDPAYVRTIGELLATVEAGAPVPAAKGTPHGLLSRPVRPAPLMVARPERPRDVRAIAPLRDLPELPSANTDLQLRRRLREYFELGRRLGVDFTDFETRSHAASLANDERSLEVLAREMFVHLVSTIAEEFESTIAQRNEVAQLVPTPSADVELDAVRESIRLGDLAGALRRLLHVRDELLRVEEEWEVGRILITECDLLVRAIRDLGGDPSPAQGPLEQGRRFLSKGNRTEAERLLARAAVALWAVLEPRFFDDLRRLRDRLNDARGAGVDIAPAVTELQDVARELRQRNFVGMLDAYRRLRSFVERLPPVVGMGDGTGALLVPPVRSDPSA